MNTLAPRRSTLFLLHFLGGSARTWDVVAAHLSDTIDCIPIDLPGFGEAAVERGHTVAQMAAAVVRRVRAEAPGAWALAGHSMGAKVAAAVARQAEDGASGLDGLSHLVLVAGSPPSPEPIPAARRAQMLAWFHGDATASRAEAEAFVTTAGGPLDAAARDRAITDVLRTDPAAWRAWLEHGSNEDWAARIGILQTPALIVAGGEDADLGPAAQERLMAPHFAHGTMVTIPGANHLLPLEHPAKLAELIRAHVA